MAAVTAHIQAVPAQNFADFEVEDDDVDIENQLWATSIAHGGGGYQIRRTRFQRCCRWPGGSTQRRRMWIGSGHRAHGLDTDISIYLHIKFSGI